MCVCVCGVMCVWLYKVYLRLGLRDVCRCVCLHMCPCIDKHIAVSIHSAD